jgi:2-hydroxychromene-2-carboxylate isomerase
MSLRDRLTRRVVPRVIVTLSDVRLPGRFLARGRRLLGGRGRVELYVAYDDPCSAVAVVGLRERLAGRRAILAVTPVVQRGIPGDPAVERKRAYAVQDAGRIARRSGLWLSRDMPLDPADTAFLAHWTAAIADEDARAAFCEAAMRRLWLEGNGPVEPESFAPLFREHAGTPPPDGADDAPVPGLPRRGLYDTPAARVQGQWFFAHERLPAIEHRLDELGWRAAA